MLQLNIEQVEALMALQRQRDLNQLSGLLASAFPQAAARLGARLGELVELGTQRGQAQGLRHALSLARYLACWFVLGAEFEARPGQEWARALLHDGARSEGAKVFQLSRRAREALARQAPAAPGTPPTLGVEGWDQALALLDAALRDRGPFGGLQRGPRLALGQPCDIDAMALRLDPVERQSYQFEHGHWTRARRAMPAAVLRVALGTALPVAQPDLLASLPPRLWLLAPGSGGPPVRLQLRCLAQACCDPQTHPLVSCNVAGRVREWRGPHAGQASLEAVAVPPEAVTDAPSPVIAQATLARLGQVEFAACGLRDEGPAIGTATTELVVLPVEQHLMVWRREPPAPWAWTETDTPEPSPSRTRLRIERDGQLLDASAWQAGWDGLDQQFNDGLGRLFGAWRRGSGLERCTLEASPHLLTGEAGLAWGWEEAPAPPAEAGPQAAGGTLTTPPAFRLKARLTTLACELGLALEGDIELLGGRARLRLHAQASVPLQAECDSAAVESPLLPDTALLQVEFMLPFILAAEAWATPDAALLHAGAATGGLVGRCGLRPRPDGIGLQWFAQLEVEPVQAWLHVESPWMGRSSVSRTLLPAMTLVDWSLG